MRALKTRIITESRKTFPLSRASYAELHRWKSRSCAFSTSRWISANRSRSRAILNSRIDSRTCHSVWSGGTIAPLLRRLKTRGRVYAVSNGDLRSGDHMPRSITIRGTFHDVCARAYAPRIYARVRFTTRAITLMLRRIRFVISCGLMQNLIPDDALGFFPRAFPCEFFEHPRTRKRCADLDDASRDFYVAIIEALSQFLRPHLCRLNRSNRTISVWKKWPVQKKVVNRKEVMEAVRYQI